MPTKKYVLKAPKPKPKTKPKTKRGSGFQDKVKNFSKGMMISHALDLIHGY